VDLRTQGFFHALRKVNLRPFLYVSAPRKGHVKDKKRHVKYQNFDGCKYRLSLERNKRNFYVSMFIDDFPAVFCMALLAHFTAV